jgi:AcrR family transcriptional regulator
MAEDKREHILLAARRTFTRLGYPAATINEIAAEAGVARGLVHHYFKNKEQLFIEVMRSMYEGALGPAAFDQIPAETPEELARGVVDLMRMAFRSAPDFFILDYESLSVSRRSEPVRKALYSLWRSYRRETEEAIERLRELGTIQTERPAPELTTMTIALIHGLGLQILGEPEIAEQEETWTALGETMSTLFSSR